MEVANKDLIIGIDAGTSFIKSVAFTTNGEQIAVAARQNQYTSLPNGGVEQNMQRTWQDTVATLQDLSIQIPDLAKRVLSLSVTGQGDGTWLIDKNGQPLHDAWLWLDARSADIANEIASDAAHDTIYKLTGTGVNVCQMRTHLRWMQLNAPDLVNKATTALHCKDWLYFCLTGQRATDPSEATFTFGNFNTRNYSEDVLDALQLKSLRHLLPPIVDGINESAALSQSVAQKTNCQPAYL